MRKATLCCRGSQRPSLPDMDDGGETAQAQELHKRLQQWRTRKGTHGVSSNGPGHTFFPDLSKLITFAAAPLVSTPFVRNLRTRSDQTQLERVFISTKTIKQ